MAVSEVNIKNQALQAVGADPIIDPNEDTRSARVMADYFETTRDAMLRRYRWNFAIKRVEDAAPTVPVPVASGFQNRFLLPADFLKFIGLFSAIELPQNYTSSCVPHLIEGQYVLADGDAISYVYIARVEDVGLFDPLFTKALIYQLAADTCVALNSNAKRADEMAAKAKDAIRDARIANSFESTPEQVINEGPLDAHMDMYGATGNARFSRRYGWIHN